MTAFVSELTLPNLIPYNNNGKWGYCNKDNKIIIDCIYDEAEPFYEGLALVKTEGSFFYINDKGENVLQTKFDNIFPFSEGLSAVVLNNKVGFINNKAKIVIPLDYLYLDENAQNYNCDFIFKNGLAKVRKKINNEIVFGFINQNGDNVIPFEYSYISDFSGGVAFALESDKLFFEFLTQCVSATGSTFDKLRNEFKKEYFLIDKNNNKIHFKGDFISNEISSFENDLSVISITFDKYYYLYSFINKEGKRKHPFYNLVGPFKEGFAYVSFLEDYYSPNNIIDGFEFINQVDNDEIRIGHANFVNKDGDEISRIYFERAFNYNNGFAAVQLNGKWGFLNKNGELVVPCIFDKVKSYSNELAAVKKENLWGFINTNGEVEIESIYQNVSSFSGNHCCVMIDNKWQIIDKNKKEIRLSKDINADEINSFEFYSFENHFYGFISVFYKESYATFKYFFYSKNNEAVLSSFTPLDNFNNNILLVKNTEYYGNKYGYVDIFGNEYFLHKKCNGISYNQRYYANPKDAFDSDEQYIDWYENQ